MTPDGRITSADAVPPSVADLHEPQGFDSEDGAENDGVAATGLPAAAGPGAR